MIGLLEIDLGMAGLPSELTAHILHNAPAHGDTPTLGNVLEYPAVIDLVLIHVIKGFVSR